MPITLTELADYCGAQINGGDPSVLIYSAAEITSATYGQVTQLTQHRYLRYIADSNASACFIARDLTIEHTPENLSLLACDDPEISFIKAVELLHPVKTYSNTVAAQAVIDATTTVGDHVYVGPYAFIGENSVIGEHCQIHAGAYIGRNVTMGKNCQIFPYAVIYDNAVIGNNVVIHSGAIIGADGFGYKFRNNQHIKVPQVGNVVIEDDVEIGANTCIDRGALASTVIGRGSKIDNLVQIGHNNKIGKHVIMCGLTGVSGSCQIEDYVILAGSSGIADHVTVGSGAVVMARSGVANDIKPGAQVFGSPAKDKKTAYKEQIAISKLPELLTRVKMLEEKLQLLEKKS